jgi:hypothetical protein
MGEEGEGSNLELLLRERNAIAREQVLLARLAEAEASVAAMRQKTAINWGVFVPVVTAVVGAAASIIVGSLTAYWEATAANAEAAEERIARGVAAEQELIKLAIGAEAGRADANMRFLSAAGLIPTYSATVDQALGAGASFSIPSASLAVCGAPGCFVDPVATHPNGQVDRIFGDYVEWGTENRSHAYTNGRKFCAEKGYARLRELEVSCAGADESAYLAQTEAGVWDYIDTGSGSSCYALISWLRCGN